MNHSIGRCSTAASWASRAAEICRLPASTWLTCEGCQPILAPSCTWVRPARSRAKRTRPAEIMGIILTYLTD